MRTQSDLAEAEARIAHLVAVLGERDIELDNARQVSTVFCTRLACGGSSSAVFGGQGGVSQSVLRSPTSMCLIERVEMVWKD